MRMSIESVSALSFTALCIDAYVRVEKGCPYVKTPEASRTNSLADGTLSHGGHFIPLTSEAFRSMISSFVLRLREEMGSGSLRT